MHVLAFHEEGQWPYANIFPTAKDAFEEALNQTNIIEQQCIEYGLESIQLDDIENFLLKAEKIHASNMKTRKMTALGLSLYLLMKMVI